MRWQDALRYVRSLRPVVNPNLGFQRQLRQFELSGQLGQVTNLIDIVVTVVVVLDLGLNPARTSLPLDDITQHQSLKLSQLVVMFWHFLDLSDQL